MKIVVSGGWSYGNIGDEAIATATAWLLDKTFPQWEKVYTAFDPKDFRACHASEALPSVHACLSRFPEPSLDADKVCADPEHYGLGDFVASLDEDTLFLMSGGGYFTENWHSQFVARLAELRLASARGAKVALIGQSIGPVYSEAGRAALKQALLLCDFLSVRDESTQRLLKELGLESHLAPDVANVMGDILPARERQNAVTVMPAAYSPYMAADERKKQNKLLQKFQKRLSPGGIRYKRQMRLLMELLAKDYPLRFVMSTRWDWDKKFTSHVCSRLKPEQYTVVDCATTEELCGELSAGGFLVSTKMHPIIISTSYGIGAIGISYNFKVSDYMASLGASHRCFRIDRVNARKMAAIVKDGMGKTVDSEALKARVYAMMRRLKETLEA